MSPPPAHWRRSTRIDSKNPERLAYHYSQTLNREKALEYLELANRKSAKANAMEEAKTYFDQAMVFLDAIPDTANNRHRRIALIANQWIVFWLLFRVPEYYDILNRHEAMAATVEESSLRARFAFALGHCQWVFGLLDRSLDTITNVATLVEEAGEIGEAGRVAVDSPLLGQLRAIALLAGTSASNVTSAL